MIVENVPADRLFWRFLMLTAAFIVAFLLEIFLPFVLGVYVWKKFGANWKVFALGAAAFVVSQIIHIPLLGLYQRGFTLLGITPTTMPFLQFNLIHALMLGLLAGICEEPMRWIAFKLLKKQGDTSRAAVMLGLGHGGVESILVGLSVMNAAIALIMWNSGN
ncbi:MAG TPA: YhfC family intramembrane metalloprotease, partial [Chloroflexi bacterium]|nr:YhfC family intramembrane metalloprotease [Chloroflexota bacterium]